MTEEWRPVVGFDNWYEVSNTGCVRSWKAPRLNQRLKEPRMLKGGEISDAKGRSSMYAYLVAADGKAVYRRISVLVWTAFMGAIPPRCGLEYIDGNRFNNSLSNLKLVEVERQRNIWKGTRARAVVKLDPVSCTIVDVYPNLTSASEACYMCAPSISNSCNGKGKKTPGIAPDGYRYVWADQLPEEGAMTLLKR